MNGWLMIGWLMIGWLMIGWLMIGWSIIGWLMIGWLMIGWLMIGWLMIGWLMIGWLMIGWLMIGWLMIGWLMIGWLMIEHRCLQIEFLFADKTGTLTKNEMKFKKFYTRGRYYDVDEVNGLVRDGASDDGDSDDDDGGVDGGGGKSGDKDADLFTIDEMEVGMANDDGCQEAWKEGMDGKSTGKKDSEGRDMRREEDDGILDRTEQDAEAFEVSKVCLLSSTDLFMFMQWHNE